MIRGLCFSLAILVIASSIASSADEKPALAEGNYIVYYAFNSSAPEQAFCLIKVEKKGGRLKGTYVAGSPKLTAEMESFAVDGRKVDIVFDLGGRKLSFEGFVDSKDPKSARGSFGDDKLLSRGKLVATDKDEIEKDVLVIKADVPDDFLKAAKLNQTVQSLKFQIQRVKGEEAREELKKKLAEAEKEAAAEAPAIYKAILEKQANNPVVVDSAIGLMRLAEKTAKPEDAAKWIKAVEAFTEPHGTRFHLDALVKCGDALRTQKGFEVAALEVLSKAEKLLTEGTVPATQVRVLKSLQSAQEKAGKADLAKQTEVRLVKLEEQLDKDYLAKVPPFKPRAFSGRKGKSERVAVFELFTGAQCPPCVAADVAFDGLVKAYNPIDLIAIQYHMHIPGPDPLTNPDCEARWAYYQEKFPMAIRGAPSTVFNGKAEGGGGGGMAQSESKFKQYRDIIDPLLEEETTIKLTGKVTTSGERITAKVDVSGVKEPGENLKLRFVLVEESIKYVGGNGIRFHHHVVRAMPGGAEGTAIKEDKLSKTVEVDLAQLRTSLKKYLTEFDADRPFPSSDRPLAFKNLRLIALVQDDTSREILQAVQFDVAGK
ncbi:MAG: hypothetical protein K8T89_06025 [Planctomycetes bacterium]|nr:hypothetical protein [Planctomycetota bacterium]